MTEAPTNPPKDRSRQVLEFEWDSWIPAYSPNARLIVQTRVLAILNDSLWFACQEENISINIASLSFGLAAMDYPLSWWLSIITSFIRKWCLQGIIAFKAVKQWAVRAYRLKEGSMARDV